MKKEKENRIEMDRRGFLKAAAISSMAFACLHLWRKLKLPEVLLEYSHTWRTEAFRPVWLRYVVNVR